MSKTVVVNVAAKTQNFPAGTVEELFVFSIIDSGSVEVASQSTADMSATFADVAAGDYTAKVSKNGVDAIATFTVPADTVSFSVPDVVTVTVQA